MRSDVDTMLLRDKSLPLHIRNLQLLMTENFKTNPNLNSNFMEVIFVEKQVSYGLRGHHNLSLPNASTKCHGLEAISFWGVGCSGHFPMMPSSQILSISGFKRTIRAWREEECNGRICKPFVTQVGFLNR